MSNPDKRGLLAGLGLGAALLVCCALPLLFAAGALGALGGFFSSPWLWAAAGLVLAIALARTATRMRSRTTQDGSSSQARGDDCCPPQRDDHSRIEPSPTQQADNNPADRRFPR